MADPGIAAVSPKVLLAGHYRQVMVQDEPSFFPGELRPLGRRITAATLGGIDVLETMIGPGIHQLEADDAGVDTGGRDTGGRDTGGRDTGGRDTGGRDTGGRDTGGRDTGGRDTGGRDTGGRDTGGADRWRWTSGPEPFYVPAPQDPRAQMEINGAPVALGPAVQLLNSAGSYLRGDGFAANIGEDTIDDGRFDRPAERFGVYGAAFVSRAETFRRVGLFCERFFAYYEETDWCWRARLRGMSIAYDPSCTIHHARGVTSGGPGDARVNFLSQRNRLLTLARNAPLRFTIAVVREKQRGPRGDGVAEIIPRLLPRALADRARLMTTWRRPASDVFEEWAMPAESWV